ncbi:MAG: lipid-A-disaccharide synthase-related protein [Oculatellaceae cyanobacterium bins.114]|nr:lipid-A-disaccharide synthase-related protein [Oculatellaceae cyanobacterium bins.114]
MKLLCLSNGHGEDAIALRILQHLQRHPAQPEIAALPLVGEGHAYRDQGIAIAGQVKRMPSGGFVYMDSRQLVRDLRGGLLQLTLKQLKVVKTWAKQGGVILAVGDVVPLLFAWWSGAPYAFVGTARSEYYLRDEAGILPRKSWFDDRLERWSDSVFHPFDRWLMSRKRCRAVFPRDGLTADYLRRRAIAAFDLGNPMMDGLEPTQTIFQEFFTGDKQSLAIALLPGSRPPEVYENWQVILQAVAGIVATLTNKPLVFLAAIAPNLDLAPLQQTLQSQGWQLTQTLNPANLVYTLHPGLHAPRPQLILTQTAFADCLHRADFAIAMAGTATEQFVGLGKPALIIPGRGPQFTPAFAEAQTRLLGASAILVKQASQVATVLQALLKDPDRLQLIAENGHRRMGNPGAAARIAAQLIEQLD